MKNLVLILLTLLINYSVTWAADQNILVSKLNEIEIEDLNLDYSLLANLEREQRVEYHNFIKDLNLISKAKFKLINGDLKLAEYYLNQLNDQESNLKTIKKRYLSLIKFINGNYAESLKYLDDPTFDNLGQYNKICLLKILNLMALNLDSKLKSESIRCMGETEKYSKNDQYWLDTMVKLKLKDSYGIKKNMLTEVEATLQNDEMSKLWLKTGVYLNKEDQLLKTLTLLPSNSYQSKKIRELIAFIYLRKGEKEKANSFIDDIDTANAENIKGNINLYDKQYELAFGHFKLALSKKSDSQNAMERALPLSWLLNQSEDGLKMVNNISNKELDDRKKSAIKIAFLIRLNKFKEASEEMNILKHKFQNIPPFEVNIMDTYIQMMFPNKNERFDKRKIEDTSELACKSFDGLNCWIALSLIHWENLAETIHRDENIINDKNQFNLEDLKKPQAIIPLKEAITIDQKDIEELDSNQVGLNLN